MVGFEYLNQRVAVRTAQPGQGDGCTRRFVPQCLHQSQDAGCLFGRADENRNNGVFLQILGQIGIDILFRRDGVFQQCLQQRVVVIR